MTCMINPDHTLTEELKNLAGPGGFRLATERDTHEPRGVYKGLAELVFRPSNANAAAGIIGRCAEANIAIVPIGGATGLVAGQTPLHDRPTILLSTERLNRIRGVDTTSKSMVAEAGVILAQAQAAAAEQQLLFPLSLAAEGSCTIGGNLATNAGGIQVLRYGNARDLCLGIEAVMPDGSLLKGLSPLRKNNTGYDLRHLLIGAEGTLGFITAASLKLYPAVVKRATALCPCPSPEAALELLARTQQSCNEELIAFELIAGQGFEFLKQYFPDLRQPWKQATEWSVLMELGSTVDKPVDEWLTDILTGALENDTITDAIICQSETQRQQFWALREHIPLANAEVGAICSADVSLPLSELATFIRTTSEKISALAGDVRVNCFGHVGDGNLHFNLFPAHARNAGDYKEIRSVLKNAVNERATELGGSFSAEHGIGRDKLAELQKYSDPVKLASMMSIKKALDPNGIMNPGALLEITD